MVYWNHAILPMICDRRTLFGTNYECQRLSDVHTEQKIQKSNVTTQKRHQNFSITQRMRTDLGRSVRVTTATQLVHGVVKPVYGIPTFQLTAKAVQSKGHIFKNL